MDRWRPGDDHLDIVGYSSQAAGVSDVKTALSSGNVVFSAPRAAPTSLERNAEAAMKMHLGRNFLTIVRPVEALRVMLEADLYTAFRLAPEAKRIVTFLREKPSGELALPIELDGARLLRMEGQDVFGAYVQNPKGPVFMTLIEKTFGKDVTTRTWDTVAKVAR